MSSRCSPLRKFLKLDSNKFNLLRKKNKNTQSLFFLFFFPFLKNVCLFMYINGWRTRLMSCCSRKTVRIHVWGDDVTLMLIIFQQQALQVKGEGYPRLGSRLRSVNGRNEVRHCPSLDLLNERCEFGENLRKLNVSPKKKNSKGFLNYSYFLFIFFLIIIYLFIYFWLGRKTLFSDFHQVHTVR